MSLADWPDIWLLQESWFSNSGAQAFTRKAGSHGYVAYTQNGNSPQTGHGKECGGAILARHGIPQQFAASFNCLDSQGVFVWVQGLLIGPFCAPPHDHCSQGACSGFVDALVQSQVNDSHQWIVGGDFNQVPTDSIFQETIEALGGELSTLGKPTRFNGRREIDWFCSNCPFLLSEVLSPDLVLSDHRILCTKVDTISPRPTRGVIPKGPSWVCPEHCSVAERRSRLEASWTRSVRDFDLFAFIESPRPTVQDKWDRFQHVLRATFSWVLNEDPGRSRKALYKGAVAQVRVENMPAYGPHKPMKERKLRRNLARWYEVSRLRSKEILNEITPVHSQELHNLCYKLTGSRAIPSGAQIHQAIESLEANLRVKLQPGRPISGIGADAWSRIPRLRLNGSKERRKFPVTRWPMLLALP